ncbi:ATP-binding protein [Streptomyces sp. ISL-66]|uniref:ATP-binding protein n=1 Tax=Streptomyces sp. ISL-66 TaxID=2819186 RepID=UPI001BE5E9C3|nr:ATP-binding protein [Streptomyces sp. ISL-66]MBT2469816.1 ATP-binding protein [Streptomyces sp. ISL-66]
MCCVGGPSGTRNGHWCETLGQAAVEAGMAVTWFSIEDLSAFVRRHRADDSIAKALARVIRSDLIVDDDIGLLPVSPDAAEGWNRLGRWPGDLQRAHHGDRHRIVPARPDPGEAPPSLTLLGFLENPQLCSSLHLLWAQPGGGT